MASCRSVWPLRWPGGSGRCWVRRGAAAPLGDQHPAGSSFFAVVYGLYCLSASQGSRLREYTRLVYLLPVLLSLDNFRLCTQRGHSTASDSPVLAIASAGLAAAGLYLGSFFGRWPTLQAGAVAPPV